MQEEARWGTGQPGAVAVPYADRSDLDLLGAVAAGDDLALAALRERHSPGLRRFLLMRVQRDQHLADEALAATWVEAWRSAGGYRASSAVRTWLYGIARHCAGRTLRWHRRLDADRSGRQRLVAFEEALHEAHLGASPDPADVVLGRPFASGLARAVARLPDELRQVLQLQFDQRFSYDEIAEILDVTEPTVRMRLQRARARVRAALDAP